MHSQHNPIAQRIDAMRKIWQKQVTSEKALVRWMLKPEESRMYEGFCRLEASPYGRLPELFVFFYTSFEDANSFSRSIISDWIKEIDGSPEMRAKITTSGVDIESWNYKSYRPSMQPRAFIDYDRQLIEMMDSFRKLTGEEELPIVIALLPQSIQSSSGFSLWLQRIMRLQLSMPLRFLILDHLESNSWGNIFDTNSDRAVTLTYDMQLDKAIKQIATGGNYHDPHVQFRKCMFEMGDASAKQSLSQLQFWGKRAIEVGTRSGNKELLATAHITYAGMLFNFREFKIIHELLNKGIEICKREIASGLRSIEPLLLQFLGFKAAAFQHEKESRQAYDWFMRQGKTAREFGLFAQSVSAFHKAFLLAQYKKLRTEALDALKSALFNTNHLSSDDIKNTEYPFAALAYSKLLIDRDKNFSVELLDQVEVRMTELFGASWRQTIERLKLNFDKKHIKELQSDTVMVE